MIPAAPLPPRASRATPTALSLALVAASALTTACGGGGGGGSTAATAAQTLSCDDSMKTAFKPDANTTVLLVKSFKKGDPLLLTGTATSSTATAGNDMCMVKLNVGPGNPGPAGAPSTSPGIGIEVWLPSPVNWNKRVHNAGGGGWAGGSYQPLTSIGSLASTSSVGSAPTISGTEGAVSSATDTGHSGSGGAFAMNPDGTINTALWNDFAVRSLHEQAVKSKALATAYYGTAPLKMYWDGGSTGGRQGLKIAQTYPDDYDAMLVARPAINWTRFITGELYPQVVMQRDLAGTPLTNDQFNQVGAQATAACDVVGGQHLGYIPDPSSCTYDPTRDAAALCSGVAGNAGVTGTNATAACVNLAQATAINKIWYGQTFDGSVPDPAVDNGWSLSIAGNQRWYGLSRGTTGTGLASPTGPFTTSSDLVALELQDPTITTPAFFNATGNGANGWKNLTYARLSNAYDQGLALQTQFGGINTDNPDLSKFVARGGKLITWHGLNDQLIPPQGTINYYNRVATQLGGLAVVQAFWKFYLVPGAGHGPEPTPNGTVNSALNAPRIAAGQLYPLLTAWVENGTVPDAIVIQSTAGTPVKSRPLCVYPMKATFTFGDPNVATSYICS